MHYLAMRELRINTAARFVCRPDWSWDTANTWWEDNDLWLVLAGSGRLDTPERSYPLCRGDCFLLRGGRRYRGSHDPEAPLTVVAVHFDVLDNGVPERPPSALPPEHRRVEDPEFVSQCVERLLRAHRAFPSPEYRPNEAVFWLEAALKEIEAVDRTTEVSSNPPEARVREVRDYILAHPTVRPTLEDLARACGLSVTHFVRLFRRLCGVPPGAYIIRNRIAAAKNLLRDSSHSIQRIAEILGYQDQFFFSRQFRKHTGTPPQEFRIRITTRDPV